MPEYPHSRNKIGKKRTENGEGKYERKREKLCSDEERKVAGKERGGNRDRDKHIGLMVNRKTRKCKENSN